MDFPQRDRRVLTNPRSSSVLNVLAILLTLLHNQSGFVLGFGIGSKVLSFIAANSEADVACWRQAEVFLG